MHLFDFANYLRLALMDSIKADHGFNMDSKSVRNLLQTMSELTPAQRRDFLQFVTGSPKLPIGGKMNGSFLTEIFTNTLKKVSGALHQCSRSCASQVNPLIVLTTTYQVS